MKKFFGILFMIILTGCLAGKAQTVKYHYKPMLTEGCGLQFSVAVKEASCCIVVTEISGRMLFQSSPEMKIRTFNGDVFTLKGSIVDDGENTSGVIEDSVVVFKNRTRRLARFSVTDEQMKMIGSGISKINLSMIPLNHNRSFTKDKIGKKLYEYYVRQKKELEDFR